MKKTVKILGIMLLLFLAVAVTTSCGADDGVPEGMQTVRGGEEYGFYMYAPVEWTVANHGDVAAAYTSKVDNSSVTFVEGEMPTVDINEYFATEMARLPFEITPAGENKDLGKACTFGNAKEAYKYIYTYTYDELPIRCMQILVKNQGRFFIFTFTSYDTDRGNGESYYDYYLPKVQTVIDSFKFVDKKASGDKAPDYPKDEDGYMLISDSKLSGFDMYVPSDWRVVDSSAIVSALSPSGENVNISKATYTGVTHKGYWEHRQEELDRIIDKVTDDEGKEKSSLSLISEGRIDRDDLNHAYYYEYEYILFGKSYRVYQALLVPNSYNGYVFTYIAEAEQYEASLDEALTVLSKTKF